MATLDDLQKMIDALNQTNSSNDKKDTLSLHSKCKRILSYIHDPYKQFYVTSKNLIKNKDMRQANFAESIFEVLDALSSREVTGHEAIGVVNDYISRHEEHRDLIYNIIDRNIKTRVDVKMINKVWPNLIPTFEVVLAKKFEDHEKSVSFDSGWFASRKLDGVRVLTVIDENGDINFFSRTGKPFTTLDKVRHEIKKLNLKNMVLDGEMCVVNEFGDENFTDMIKLIRKKDFTVPNPCYKLFDVLTLRVFNQQLGGSDFSIRYYWLKNNIPENNKILNVVEQTRMDSVEEFEGMQKKVAENGWEGFMLRKDTEYEGKRTKNLLKVKKFFDAEYVVEDIETGDIRYIKNGIEDSEEMLSAVKITHKGQVVSVGSGFSMQERIDFYQNPTLILGKTITVKYFEETTNDKGTISLRFPTVKCIHGDKREV